MSQALQRAVVSTGSRIFRPAAPSGASACKQLAFFSVDQHHLFVLFGSLPPCDMFVLKTPLFPEEKVKQTMLMHPRRLSALIRKSCGVAAPRPLSMSARKLKTPFICIQISCWSPRTPGAQPANATLLAHPSALVPHAENCCAASARPPSQILLACAVTPCLRTGSFVAPAACVRAPVYLPPFTPMPPRPLPSPRLPARPLALLVRQPHR